MDRLQGVEASKGGPTNPNKTINALTHELIIIGIERVDFDNVMHFSIMAQDIFP
jgi:hypothetical protein